jgi:hypothetical protein
LNAKEKTKEKPKEKELCQTNFSQPHNNVQSCDILQESIKTLVKESNEESYVKSKLERKREPDIAFSIFYFQRERDSIFNSARAGT